MSLNFKELTTNLSKAFLAQSSALVLSALSSFVVPKYLGIDSYGYFQLYLFYVSYVGFFHLGVNDGIYLINGGKSRAEMDVRSIKSQAIIAVLSQLLISAIIVLIVFYFEFNHQRAFVLYAFAASIVVVNLTSLLGYYFQAANETALFSISCIIDKIAAAIIIVILLAVHCDNFEFYVAAVYLPHLISLGYCLRKARELTSAKALPMRQALRDTIFSIKVGVKLLLANLCAALILGAARFLVDQQWGIEQFSQISIAITIATLISSFVNQAAMVLFPALRQAESEELQAFYSKLKYRLEIFLPCVCVFYFPAQLLLSMWIPDYSYGLNVLAYVMPICILDSKMSLIGTTFFKVLRGETRLLQVNLVSVMLSVAFSYCSIVIFGSIELCFAMISLIMLLRTSFCDRCITNELDVRRRSTSTAELVFFSTYMLVCFSIASPFLRFAATFAIYALYIIAIVSSSKRAR